MSGVIAGVYTQDRYLDKLHETHYISEPACFGAIKSRQ